MKRLLFALLAACTTTQHQSSAARDIDRFVEQTLREIPETPSLAVAVVENGRTIDLRNADTAYYIGSTTKAYTGLACAILANRGLLDLDAPLNRYLPEVNITVPLRSFLTHTSGIENNGIVFRTAFSGEHTQAQLVSLLNESRPGKGGFRYDNLGYVVASLVMERITGKPWQQTLDELVFTPLGMDHTTAYMSEAEKWTLATPYQMNRKGELAILDFRKNDQMMHAAGGIVTTPRDLARWLEANLTNGRIGSRQAIPAAAFEEAHRMQVPVEIARGDFKSRGYGFGWYQADYEGNSILFHQGGFEGWQSNFSFMPEKKIAVGVMTNASGPAPFRIGQLVAQSIYDRLLQKPNADAVYAERLAKLKAEVARGKSEFLADVQKRAARPWMLQHSNEAYVGRYENPMYGTIVIEQRGDRLVASLGHLNAVIEPFTEPESARVELIPGTGEVLRFQWGSGPTPESLKWGESTFTRFH